MHEMFYYHQQQLDYHQLLLQEMIDMLVERQVDFEQHHLMQHLKQLHTLAPQQVFQHKPL